MGNPGLTMVAAERYLPTPTKHTRPLQSMAWFSSDGSNWGRRHSLGDPAMWLWRVTWHRAKAYSAGYGTSNDQRLIRIYKSDNGKQFQALVEKAYDNGLPNEASLLFLADDTCYCLLRHDGESQTGRLGISSPPYFQWKWKDLGVRIGGPDVLQLSDGRIVAVVRLYDGRHHTGLCWIDPEAGTLIECIPLPSGKDESYAGLVWYDDMLWISYYSAHEGKANIYLAKVRFDSST